MIQHYLNILIAFSRRKRSLFFKVVSLLAGACIFLIIIPIGFVVFRRTITYHNPFHFPLFIEQTIAVLSILVSVFSLVWSVITQWSTGKGTPSPLAPTQHLITTGPYRLCRNPIQLGALLYYLGVVTFFDNLTTGIVLFLAGLIIGSGYHKFIEEKELLIRFGEDYRIYKEKTPFLIPRLFR